VALAVRWPSARVSGRVRRVDPDVRPVLRRRRDEELALRMRAGQQLVFGEQIGWINPGLAQEKENAEFFKSVVHLRRQLRRYFYAGEMARPPQLTGNVPTVRADWQWGGHGLGDDRRRVERCLASAGRETVGAGLCEPSAISR